MAEARSTGAECVLIDTAGRMQNNDKLMRELAKLVQVRPFHGNHPGAWGFPKGRHFSSSLTQHARWHR